MSNVIESNGNVLTINGTPGADLSNAEVKIKGKAEVINGDSFITVNVPTGIPDGAVTITLTTTSNDTSTDTYLSTHHAVRIPGARYRDARAMIEIPPVPPTYNLETKIIVTLPPELPAGELEITVALSSGSDTCAHSYVPTPTVTAVYPPNGPIRGGIPVTITGQYLLGATAVAFGGCRATFKRDSDVQITAVLPLLAAGEPCQIHVMVTTQSGQSAATPANLFTYDGAAATTRAGRTTRAAQAEKGQAQSGA